LLLAMVMQPVLCHSCTPKSGCWCAAGAGGAAAARQTTASVSISCGLQQGCRATRQAGPAHLHPCTRWGWRPSNMPGWGTRPLRGSRCHSPPEAPAAGGPSWVAVPGGPSAAAAALQGAGSAALLVDGG
jgi:hypothetical protein